MLFENDLVVITGAAKGIGAAAARAFSREGAVLALLDVDDSASAVARALGERSQAIHCDVSSSEDVQQAFTTIRTSLGLPRVLVNNAGIQTYGTCADTAEK